MSSKIHLTRLMPNRGEVNIQKGSEVSPTQIIARSYKSAKFYILEAGKIPGIEIADLDKNLLVEVGAPLEEGTPLIRKSKGSDKERVFSSPVSGVLVEVFEGNLVIQRPQKLFELRAMVQGKVSKIIPQMGAEIQLTGSLVQAVWSSGRESQGPLFISTKNNVDNLSLEDIRSEMGRSIVVAGRLSSSQLLEVLENFQVRGLIVGSLPAALIPHAREVMFPVYVTDGFGDHPMNAHIFRVFLGGQGKDTSLLNGSWERGEQRSQIVVNVPESQNIKTVEAEWNLLKTGDIVRVIKSRNNLTGKVKAVHPEARRTISGGWMPGADIELENGESLSVPYSNIDVINGK